MVKKYLYFLATSRQPCSAADSATQAYRQVLSTSPLWCHGATSNHGHCQQLLFSTPSSGSFQQVIQPSEGGRGGEGRGHHIALMLLLHNCLRSGAHPSKETQLPSLQGGGSVVASLGRARGMVGWEKFYVCVMATDIRISEFKLGGFFASYQN